MSQQNVIAYARALLQEVTGVRDEDIAEQPGGTPSWIDTPTPGQSYWELDILSAEDGGLQRGSKPPIGQAVFEHYTVRVEGWMPFGYRERSARTWRALTDRLRTKLRENRHLGQQSGYRTGAARGRFDYDVRAGGTDPDEPASPQVRCHHAVIEFDVRYYHTYTMEAAT